MQFDPNTTPFVRWSANALPSGEKISTLPVVTMNQFLNEITNGNHTPYKETAEEKRFNPGIFNTNNTLFLDIDHIDDYFETIWNSLEDILVDCPFVAMVKQSRSKSLHFICIGHWNTVEEHAERDMFYLACVAKSILVRTGIDLRNEEKVLDVHTKSSDQRLFVYDPEKHPVKVNPFPTVISLDGMEKAFQEYPMLRPVKTEKVTIMEGFEGKFDARIRPAGEKITLDRNYGICGYYGNDARWRVANAICHICHGDKAKAKEIISNNFTNPKDFSFASVGKGVNHNVLNWVIENLQKTYGGDCTGWISDKMDEIIEFIGKHPRTLLVAPTGSGKTSLVNAPDGLARKLNAVVVTPFNSMLQLYNSMTAIHSNQTGGANLQDYRSDEPVVIIWDQVNKLINKIREDNRPVIVDESHTLFMDREYRDSAVKLMDELKTLEKVICITATPSGEEQELNLDRIEYKSNKGIVNTIIQHTENNIGISILGDVVREFGRNDYDRVVVFSDLYVRRLHENLNSKMIPHSYIHSRNRNGEDFIRLQETELLDNKITLCTSLAFNGLNFRNENERVLCIMDVREGETLPGEVIQCVGRLRKSAVSLKMYVSPAGVRAKVEQREMKANLVSEARMDGTLVPSDSRLLHQENVSALKRIESYLHENSTLEKIKQGLLQTGYFFIREVWDNREEPINAQLQLQEKRKMESVWMEGFLAGAVTNDSEVRENEYFRAVNRLWNSLVWDFAMRADTVKEILINKKGDKLVSTVLEELRKKCIVNSYTDDEYSRMVSNLECWISDKAVELGAVVVKQLKSNLKDMKKWRERYIQAGVAVGDLIRLLAVEEEDLCKSLFETKQKRSEAHSAPRKKKLYKCQSGFIGTREEIAEHLGISIEGVKYQIKKGLTIPA